MNLQKPLKDVQAQKRKENNDMSFVEDFEAELNEIKRVHDEKIAEIYGKMQTAITNKNDSMELYELYRQLGEFDKAIDERRKIEVYDETAKMYQAALVDARKEQLISQDMHKTYSQRINETYAPKAGEAYKKVLSALNEARAALFEVKEINDDAHICKDLLCAVERYTDSGIEYPPAFSNYAFIMSDYITTPLGFATIGRRRTLEECCSNNDLFRQLKLKIEQYSGEKVE